MLKSEKTKEVLMTRKQSDAIADNSQEGNDLLAEMLKKHEDNKGKEMAESEQHFISEISSGCQKPSYADDLDDSANLVQGLMCEDEKEEDLDDYPHFKIYAGENGTFELSEKGKKKVKKISETEYPLPLDTDITKINAYRISTRGDWSEIKDVGPFIINATLVEFENCYDLEKLPPMSTVQVLKVRYCYELRSFDPKTRVKYLEVAKSNIQFLPKSLSSSKIKIESCGELKYIHPAIPVSAISGVDEKEIKACKMRYMLSEYVSDTEKRLYPIEEKRVLINNPELRTLPECFNRPNIILENCEKLEFIHPSINPKKIKGMSGKDIYHCQMMYLFKKMNENDPSFDFWFNRVKANLGRTRE